LAIEQVPKEQEVAHGATMNWTRAKHRVGLERPHFCTRFRAQSDSWVAPAQLPFGARERGENLEKQVKKVGITYFSFVFTIFFSL